MGFSISVSFLAYARLITNRMFCIEKLTTSHAINSFGSPVGVNRPVRSFFRIQDYDAASKGGNSSQKSAKPLEPRAPDDMVPKIDPNHREARAPLLVITSRS